LIKGRVFSFWCFIAVTIVVFWAIYTARKGRQVKVRAIPALDAIPEAVGRSVEMGRPVMFNLGIADIIGDTAAQTLAGLGVLSYVAGLCADYDTRILVPITKPNVLPLAEETVRTAYFTKGKLDKYDPNWIQYLSDEQWAYVSGVMGMTQREKPGACILVGGFWSETLMVVECANSVGAIQIGGTGQLPQVPFFVAACDYALIGEEIYAARAVVSQDVQSLGSIDGQDLVKLISIILIVAGIALSTFGSSWLVNITKL